MVTKEAFLARMQSQSSLSPAEMEELSSHWEDAHEAATIVEAAMPGIGFLSTRQRLNAFFAVCRHLDQMIDGGEIDLARAQLAMSILRVSNKRFLKAVTMFDVRHKRFDASARADMPETAREYLAGLDFMGR